MLKVCICDDQLKYLETIQTLVEQYIAENQIEAEIEVFSHPDKLLSALESRKFHLYLLDMVMPMANGIDIGKVVRKNDSLAQIIYITSAPEYALDSFIANPIDYIVKPIQPEKLFHALKNAIQRVDILPEKSLLIKTKDSLYTIYISQIVYLEYVRHSVIFVLSNGEHIQSITMKESFSEYIQDVIQNNYFIKPHTSYIVNMQYVERLSKEGFQLKGDYFVPISRKKYVEIRNKYLNFRLEV